MSVFFHFVLKISRCYIHTYGKVKENENIISGKDTQRVVVSRVVVLGIGTLTAIRISLFNAR